MKSVNLGVLNTWVALYKCWITEVQISGVLPYQERVVVVVVEQNLFISASLDLPWLVWECSLLAPATAFWRV